MTKVRRVTDDRNLFLLKDIVRLPDVRVRQDEEPVSFDLIHSARRNGQPAPVRPKQLVKTVPAQIAKKFKDLIHFTRPWPPARKDRLPAPLLWSSNNVRRLLLRN